MMWSLCLLFNYSQAFQNSSHLKFSNNIWNFKNLSSFFFYFFYFYMLKYKRLFLNPTIFENFKGQVKKILSKVERADVACPKYTVHICHHNVLRKRLSPISCKPTLHTWLEEKQNSANLHETLYNVLIDVQGRSPLQVPSYTPLKKCSDSSSCTYIYKPTAKIFTQLLLSLVHLSHHDLSSSRSLALFKQTFQAFDFDWSLTVPVV